MSGYIIYWSKEYIEGLSRAEAPEKISVVYGGFSTKLPSLSKVRVGDVVYPVTISDSSLCVMARLPIEKTETAFDYLMRETGRPYDSLVPDDCAVKHEYKAGNNAQETFYMLDSRKYENINDLPKGTKILVLDFLQNIPHKLSQEPPARLAASALSGTDGSEIKARIIPDDVLSELRFGSSKNSQKPLKFDKNGKIVTSSIMGHARLMSDETQKIFDSLFEKS